MDIRLVNDLQPPISPPYVVADNPELDTGSAVNIRFLVRRYWLLLIVLMILGGAAGFISVVLSSPMYRARLMLETLTVNEAWLKNSFNGTSFEANEVNIQT